MSITSIQSILRSNLPRGPVGSVGFTGSSGFTGSRGETGSFGGVTFEFTFSSDTDSSQDPGSGRLKFNDTNMLSATQLYIKNADNNNTNLDSYLATIDASTSELKGHFKILNRASPENFIIFAVTGDSEKIGDYFIIPCAYVSGVLTDSSTSFEQDDSVLITFARTGDRGDTGFTGSRGDSGFTGSLGYTGSRGETGSGFNFVGSVSTGSQLDLSYPGDINDAYLVEDTGFLWIWDGSSWGPVGQFTGYSGSLGYTGSKGEGLDPWIRVTSNYTASTGNRLIADTSGGSFTITLPSNPEIGTYVVLTDGGDWETNSLLIDSGIYEIEGNTGGLDFDIGGVTTELLFDGTMWQLTATLGAEGPPGIGIPLGGATGQVLAKASGGDYDAVWRDVVGSLEITGSTISTSDSTDVSVDRNMRVNGDLNPELDSVFDLGSPERKWRSLHVSGQTIYLGNASISVDTQTGGLLVTPEGGQPVAVGSASVDVSATAPADPESGDMWYDSANEQFLIYVTNQWVPAGGASIESSATAPANPSEGDLWLDSNTGIVSVYYGGGWLSVSGGDVDFANIPTNVATAGTVKASTPFFLNPKVITANYTIPADTNAMTAGPIEIGNGVTVTVSDGGEWSIV